MNRELLAAEIAAVLEADIRVRLIGQQITAATLKGALIESARSLALPSPAVHVERDPLDPNRIIISGIGVDALRHLTGKARS